MSPTSIGWRRLDLPVWVAFVVLLLLGWGLRAAVEARTINFTDPQGTLRLDYPEGWLPVPGSAATLDVENPLAGGAVPARLIVTREGRPEEQTISNVATETIMARAHDRAMYRALAVRERTVAGREAVAVEYAYVADPHAAAVGSQRVPIVVRGIEVVFFVDQILYRVDLSGDAARFREVRALLDRLLSTLSVDGGAR